MKGEGGQRSWGLFTRLSWLEHLMTMTTFMIEAWIDYVGCTWRAKSARVMDCFLSQVGGSMV